jgi:hypothetical protein
VLLWFGIETAGFGFVIIFGAEVVWFESVASNLDEFWKFLLFLGEN